MGAYEEPIFFESEEELVEFVKKFQQVFREFIGLNLDGKPEAFSPAEAMSNLGQFPPLRAASDDGEPEEPSQEEENRWCVIL